MNGHELSVNNTQTIILKKYFGDTTLKCNMRETFDVDMYKHAEQVTTLIIFC